MYDTCKFGRCFISIKHTCTTWDKFIIFKKRELFSEMVLNEQDVFTTYKLKWNTKAGLNEQSSPLSCLTAPGKGQEKARKCFGNSCTYSLNSDAVSQVRVIYSSGIFWLAKIHLLIHQVCIEYLP